ncbi:transporter [Flavobacterium sp.]|uniref:transporter n=1 Tax=Flavobacterium sp. TaxID=239 RepID=UPI00286D5129|nr:transporter [Flavobacterium sp.]
MFKIKSLVFIFLVFYSTINYAQFTDVINSNRPGQSMAAFSVGKTVIQAELGINRIIEKDKDVDYKAAIWNSDLALRYGVFFEQFELIANLEYQNEKFTAPGVDIHEGALKKVLIGAKYLIYDPEKNYEKKPNLYSWKANHKFNWRQFIPAVGIYGGVNANLAKNKFLRGSDIPRDEDFTLKGMILTQNQFGRYTFLTNIILDKFPSQRNSIDYVLTMTRGFNDRVSGFLEIQGFNNEFYKDHFLRTGAAYLVRQNIQVDASVASNFQASPNIVFAGVGASWRFDANYNEVMLRVPKEEKNDGKSKKEKKDKEKKDKEKKKRKDAVENTEFK